MQSMVSNCIWCKHSLSSIVRNPSWEKRPTEQIKYVPCEPINPGHTKLCNRELYTGTVYCLIYISPIGNMMRSTWMFTKKWNLMIALVLVQHFQFINHWPILKTKIYLLSNGRLLSMLLHTYKSSISKRKKANNPIQNCQTKQKQNHQTKS